MNQNNNSLTLRSQADAAWKSILEQFFEETIAFSFPALYADIDWTHPWDFLDKELQVISQDSIDGTRFVDKLIRVYLKNGNEKWLLIHIEIQGSQDSDFSKRMFIYHYRSFDKFGLHPVSCAILTDESKTWRPEKYENRQSGCELFFKFPILKLLDLESQRDLLEKSLNPFACIILTQLNALTIKKRNFEQRYHVKLSETKRLYEKGFSGAIIRQLFHFIDALIRLPTELELQFKNDIFKFEEDNRMTYISSIEQMGIEKGIQQGIQQGMQQGMQQGVQQGMQQGIQYGKQQGLREIALRMLRKGQSLEMISDITGLNKKELATLATANKEILNT